VEVAEPVQRTRRIQVVRAEDEEGCDAAADRAQHPDCELDGLGLADDVAGDYRDIGSREPLEEPRHPPITVLQMEVGEVEDAEAGGTRR
jgi:hypothetical protein